jgi:hypothetical protein
MCKNIDDRPKTTKMYEDQKQLKYFREKDKVKGEIILDQIFLSTHHELSKRDIRNPRRSHRKERYMESNTSYGSLQSYI